MKKKSLILLFGVFILLTFASCGSMVKKPNKPEPVLEIKTRIVKAKTINHVDGSALSRGNTYYVLAFTNGETDYVTFGEYSNIEEGDTITYERMSDEFFWRLILNTE